MPSLIIPTITAAIVVTLVIVVVRRTLVVVTVTGPSMAPTLADGDRVLVVRRWARPVRRGDIVAARHGDIVAARHGDIAAARRGDIAAARSDWIIKRAVAVAGDATPAPEPDLFPANPAIGAEVPAGTVFLVGDNGAVSADSRLWGALPLDRVVGVMVRRLSSRQ